MAAVAAPKQLSQIFGSVPVSEHPKQWDSCYRESFHPWDRAGPSLALADLLIQRSDLIPPSQQPVDSVPAGGVVKKKTALVPGCGLGHDVLLLASFGYDVTGLDVSETAIEQARRQQKTAEEQGQYPTKEGVVRGSITWLNADFFSEDWSANAGADGSGKFDLVYDYTFLCALPLDLRPRWAQRITELVHHKGRLVCLEFPSGKALRDGGPPWGVNPEVYEALLGAPGEPIAYDDKGDGSVVSIPSPKPRDYALHRLSIIKPPRTHKAGTGDDGSIKDFISVWSA